MAAPPISAAGSLQRAHGVLRLKIRQRDGRSVLQSVYQQAPCRALMPSVEPGAPFEAVLVNTSGGLVGGDRIESAIAIGADASAVLAGQAAEKVYRSTGADTVVETSLSVADGGWLEWLPQETILFDGARLRRRLSIDLAPAARLLAAETVVFGRAARGERFSRGFLHDSWAICRAGRLAWMDAVRLDGDVETQRTRAFGFGRAAGYATLLHAGPEAASFLPLAREIVASAPAEGGATMVSGLLLLRFIAEDAARLRSAVAAAVCRLRAEIAGLPAKLPRVWQI
jgi:urease accessory protein